MAYMHVLALVLRHRFLVPIRQAVRHRLRVADIRHESSTVVTIVVEGQHLRELQA